MRVAFFAVLAGSLIVGPMLALSSIAVAADDGNKSPDMESCGSDDECLAIEVLEDANRLCSEKIERLASYSFKWTDSFLNPLERFSIYVFSQKKTRVNYYGDSLKFQNGFGAWYNMKYACTFDIGDRAVVEVKAARGRLDEAKKIDKSEK